MTQKALTRLQEAYLEELNLLHRVRDDATASERDTLIERAATAEATVHAAFDELSKSGRLKELSAAYKAKRDEKKAKGQAMIPWSAYLLDEKRRMIRAMAQEQRSRARRGVAP